MAARVGQAGGPVSFGHSPRRRERPASSGARLVVQSNVLYPKGAAKPVSPPNTKKKGRSPTFAKSASSSPPPGTNHYAGPKFSEPPSPAALPQPPTHWVAPEAALPDASTEVCLEMTNQLKMLLKVNA